MKKFYFDKPYTFEGQEYTSIDFNFEMLTGEMFEAVASSLTSFTPVPAFDPKFIRGIAMQASGLSAPFFLKMPLQEYQAVSAMVQAFLFGTDSGADSAQELLQ